MTAQEAAKLLLDGFEDPWHGDKHIPGFKDIDWQKVYNAMTADHIETIENGGGYDWPSLLIVALREIAGVE